MVGTGTAPGLCALSGNDERTSETARKVGKAGAMARRNGMKRIPHGTGFVKSIERFSLHQGQARSGHSPSTRIRLRSNTGKWCSVVRRADQFRGGDFSEAAAG